MRIYKEKYISCLISYSVLWLSLLPIGSSQEVLKYGPGAITAGVHYNGFLYDVHKTLYSNLPEYPVKGAYSPSHYANTALGIPPGTGACNYIYIPTKGALIPGHQYTIKLTVSLAGAYNQVPYFQSNFGIGLTSELFENYFGLWRIPFVPLNIQTTEKPVTVEFTFRPLCDSKYLVLGVFQGVDMDSQDCFACQYSFELYNLTTVENKDSKADFVYLCDAFEEEKAKKHNSTGYDIDTVYFESGSAEIFEGYNTLLDSIPYKLRTKQDLIILCAYTDNEGIDNEALGAARNIAVVKTLIERGVDSTRILLVNYGETKASNKILKEDRRVEIYTNRGKLYQKYYTEALQAAARGEYGVAKINIVKWAKIVPPDIAIYALFDCWGDGPNLDMFKLDILKAVRTRSYPAGKEMKFFFDSLYCEDQRGRTLSVYLRLNYLPDFHNTCDKNFNSFTDFPNPAIIDRIYSEHGFPTVEEVGSRGNQALPYMILHVTDTMFQNRYLPLIKKACEDQVISWEYYAMLYDKISIVSNGRQRYGTQWIIDQDGVLTGLYPFENLDMVPEYRKQVGLAPLSDF